jgi:hypothetical protein
VVPVVVVALVLTSGSALMSLGRPKPTPLHLVAPLEFGHRQLHLPLEGTPLSPLTMAAKPLLPTAAVAALTVKTTIALAAAAAAVAMALALHRITTRMPPQGPMAELLGVLAIPISAGAAVARLATTTPLEAPAETLSLVERAAGRGAALMAQAQPRPTMEGLAAAVILQEGAGELLAALSMAALALTALGCAQALAAGAALLMRARLELEAMAAFPAVAEAAQGALEQHPGLVAMALAEKSGSFLILTKRRAAAVATRSHGDSRIQNSIRSHAGRPWPHDLRHRRDG